MVMLTCHDCFIGNIVMCPLVGLDPNNECVPLSIGGMTGNGKIHIWGGFCVVVFCISPFTDFLGA